jgi:cold shock CspA family protein
MYNHPSGMEYTFYTQTYTGVVARFNWDKRFGFINVVQPVSSDRVENLGQIFVHLSHIEPHSPLAVSRKKLITGEWVMFEIAPSQDASKNQRPQAIHVRGMYGLPLICEHGAVDFSSYERRQFIPDAATEVGSAESEAAASEDQELREIIDNMESS